MGTEESSQEVINERKEVQRALAELDGWHSERLKAFESLQAYIQDGLQSGLITECQKHGTGKKYLTRRMIATLAVDQKMMLRTLFLLNFRRKQMKKRLEHLDKSVAGNNSGTQDDGDCSISPDLAKSA